MRNRLCVLLAVFVIAASEPNFRAHMSDTFSIAPNPDFRKITTFDLWSSSAGLTSDGRCVGISFETPTRRLMDVAHERCAYAKRNENGFPSVPCRNGQSRNGSWIISCRNLPTGSYELIGEFAESIDAKARVEILSATGEALHMGIFSLHDHLVIRVLSINSNGLATHADYFWPAGSAARYFRERARSTPRS